MEVTSLYPQKASANYILLKRKTSSSKALSWRTKLKTDWKSALQRIWKCSQSCKSKGRCINCYWNPVEWVVAEYNKFANINCSLKSKEGIDALPLTEHCTWCKFKSAHIQMNTQMFKSLSVFSVDSKWAEERNAPIRERQF